MSSYFQSVRGATPILSGVYLLPTAISLAISSIGTGVFIKKTGEYKYPMFVGFFFMTLGFGLFIDFDADSSWAKLIIFQIIAGMGIGPLFQSPIIAIQAHINPRDIATATATLGFVRQLATSTSVVIGQVVFQNQMAKKNGLLTAVLGPQLAQQLGGANAGANANVIDSLPPDERSVYRNAFATSLQPMWIMYTCFASVGLIAALGVRRKALTREHTETKTGMVAERENAALNLQEKKDKRASKIAAKRGSVVPSRPQTASSEAEKSVGLEKDSGGEV